MSKRKLFEDVEELFVNKPTETFVTKTIGIESHEFLKKISFLYAKTSFSGLFLRKIWEFQAFQNLLYWGKSIN